MAFSLPHVCIKNVLKLKCRRFKKSNNWKIYILLILNLNPNLGIQKMKFQLMNFKSFMVYKDPNKEL